MIVTVTWIGLAAGLGVVVVVDTGTGVALMPLLLLWQVLHAEYGMVSCVTVLVVVTTAVGEPDGVAVALTATVATGTGSTSLAVLRRDDVERVVGAQLDRTAAPARGRPCGT